MKHLYPGCRKLLCYFSFCLLVITTKAQDLPGASANSQIAPAGSYVIAMDNVNQATSIINSSSGAYLFNLKAYGLAVWLLDVNYKLRWVIKAGKTKDAIDFSASAERIAPSYQAAQNRDFLSGPILIFPQDTLAAYAVIGIYNSFLPDSCKVKVYRLQNDVMVDVRYNLTKPPKAALLHDSCDIHRNYMEMASVPTINYRCLPNASTLRMQCYTFASDPHVTPNEVTPADADSIYNFVMAGGNFLAECEGVESFEGLKKFQSATGVVIDPTGGQFNNFNNNVFYDNPDMAYGQYQGSFKPWLRGAQKVWRYSGTNTNNFYSVTSCKRNGADDLNYVATVSKLTSDTGSLVFYLGNHEYYTHDCHTCVSGTSASQEEVNGVRLYLNALLIPSKFLKCVNVYDIPLAVTLTGFNVYKRTDESAQLKWAASNEDESMWYIIEHSTNGNDFNMIAKVDANGTEGRDFNYDFLHTNPAEGINYYRIKMVSPTGKPTYSQVRKIVFDKKHMSLHLFPNPASDKVQIMVDAKEGERMLVEFYDISGHLAGQVLTTIRDQQAQLNIGQLPAGLYMVVGSTLSGENYKAKLIVR